jgi:two-component system chemotaxis response regulator CheY
MAIELQTQILIIDDEKFIRQLVSRTLHDLGYRFLKEAEDGEQGLKILNHADGLIEVVLLDIEMPKVSGLDFLRVVRSHEKNSIRKVPVIMLTGHSDMDHVREAAKIGIHGFLAKPVSKANLDKQIKRALSEPPIDPAKLQGS